MVNTKKVMFIDATLHKRNATGITLSNLFGSWSKDNLFMIGTQEMIAFSRMEGYQNTYVIDDKDYYHRFPLGLLLHLWKLFKKNNLTKKSKGNPEIKSVDSKSGKLSNKYFFRTLALYFFQRLGLDHLFFRQIISADLREWVEKSKPDYFYAVLSTRHSILFAEKLVIEFKKPFIIHIMDDWPTTIGHESYFYKYWNKIINRELIKLMVLSHKRVAISKLMAQEYEYRFRGKWYFFHNPIDLSKWESIKLPLIKNYYNQNIKFGYFGRIGRANEFTLYALINALKELNFNSLHSFELTVYSSDKLPENLTKFSFITQSDFIEHAHIPHEMRLFDFLVLPLSFDKRDFHFAKFSIPTKFSEYLISGVPCLAIVPEEFALSKFISENNCAFLINSIDIDKIKENVLQIIYDSNKLREISEIAITVSKSHFSQNVVQSRFIELFNSHDHSSYSF